MPPERRRSTLPEVPTGSPPGPATVRAHVYACSKPTSTPTVNAGAQGRDGAARVVDQPLLEEAAVAALQEDLGVADQDGGFVHLSSASAAARASAAASTSASVEVRASEKRSVPTSAGTPMARSA